jgi:UDP-N-acetylmuramate--alanine ligase
MGLANDVIRQAFAGFKGVKRRFTKTGELNGVTVIEDYGQHPHEIAAVLRAARSAAGEAKVIAVVQPHRYTRLHSLFDEFCTCFNDADAVIVADVYAAGEAPIDGVNADTLAASLKSQGHRDARRLGSLDDLAAFVRAEAQPGDIVVCLGAGDISAYANALPGKLAAAAA